MASTDASDRVVVLLHGRGGVASDLAWLEDWVPHPWRSVLLQAPLPLGERFEWFRVPEDASQGPGPRSQNVAPAADRLAEWLDQQFPCVRVGLVGYSQGGAVALQALRRHPGRFQFVAIFAGFTTVDAEPTDIELATRRPLVLWGRGTDDDVIPASDIARMREFLPVHTALDERVYAGAGHEITAAMAVDLSTFIRTLTEEETAR